MVIRCPPSRWLHHGTCAAEKGDCVYVLDHNLISLKRSLVGKWSSSQEMKTTLSVPLSDSRVYFLSSPSTFAFASSPCLHFQAISNSARPSTLIYYYSAGANFRQSFTTHMGSSRNTLMCTLASSLLQPEE